MTESPGVLELREVGELAVNRLFSRYGLRLAHCAGNAIIRGSFWGAPEAGLIGDTIYARPDTPVHSVLHEACHNLCMTPARRLRLHTDAGGDHAEENCVCYMQIVLAEFLPGMGRDRMLADMDAWGYTFRLGSARAWFEHDAVGVVRQLCGWGMLTAAGRPTWRRRGASEAPEFDVLRA